MIDLHYWITPNGHKITVALEELAMPYRILPVNILKGEQFNPDFLRIAPNNRIPAIIDHAPADGGASLSLFESGAILHYLADKGGALMPMDARGRSDVLEWVFWQAAGLGPMGGQAGHFLNAAPERIPYAIERYTRETSRLFAVLDKRLSDRDYIAVDYSIADISCYPWIISYARMQQDINDYPNLKRWIATIAARPAVQRAYAVGEQVVPSNTPEPSVAEMNKILYRQDAATVRGLN